MARTSLRTSSLLVAGLLSVASALAGEEVPSDPLQAQDTLLASYPPCFDVTLTADATGRAPLAYTWTLPDGSTLQGNPVHLDTGRLPTGWNEVLLTVSNDAGSDTVPQHVIVEALGFASSPTFVVDGLSVQATANTTGATEWRWTWGDGFVSDWAGGCTGYAPSHTYLTAGTYSVTLEARSCREQGAIVHASVTVGASPSPTIERFQALCPTEPFCSFAVGETVLFDTVVTGTVDAYLYDWNGDGADDQVTTEPVGSHVFQTPGLPVPRLTVLADQAAETAYHVAPIEILRRTAPLFADDFELGTLERWSLP